MQKTHIHKHLSFESNFCIKNIQYLSDCFTLPNMASSCIHFSATIMIYSSQLKRKKKRKRKTEIHVSMYTSTHFLLQLLLFYVGTPSQAGLKPRIFLPQHQEYCDFRLVATPCFHPSSALEAVTLLNGPLPSFSNTLSRSFPVFAPSTPFSSFCSFWCCCCFFIPPTPFPALSVALSSLSLSQVPVQTLPVLLLFLLLLFSQQKPHFSSFSPYFSKRQKSGSHLTNLLCTQSHPSLFSHPFLSCFYLGFRLFSLLEYLFLDTPTCCLF